MTEPKDEMLERARKFSARWSDNMESRRSALTGLDMLDDFVKELLGAYADGRRAQIDLTEAAKILADVHLPCWRSDDWIIEMGATPSRTAPWVTNDAYVKAWGTIRVLAQSDEGK